MLGIASVTSAQDGTGDVDFTDSDDNPIVPDVRAADDSVTVDVYLHPDADD